MRPALTRLAVALATASAMPLAAQDPQGAPPPIVLDDFETPAGWGPNPADGVSLAIGSDAGADSHGRAMRLDFDFHGHGGYAVVRRAMWIALPENYEISFKVRGRGPVNNLEFKLIDPSGDNVWWNNRRNFSFPDQWTTIRIRPRDLTFAWGPAGGGVMHYANAIELAISTGSGGKGSVWIDDLVLIPRAPDRPYDLTPRATASSAAPSHGAAAVLDGDSTSEWRSAPGARTSWVQLDFLRRREFSGVVLDWDRAGYASSYTVDLSDDGRRWTTAYRVTDGDGGRDYIPLPETESRYMRLSLTARSGGEGYALRAIDVKPLAWAASPNAFFTAIAADAPRGTYPRYFLKEQAFWTIAGVSGDGQTSLLSENGSAEPLAGGFTIEPFLETGSGLVTWHDVARRQWLERGSLPIPSVEWQRDSLALTVTALATGVPKASTLVLRYRAENHGAAPLRATLYLAVRPFQVNPPWQFLNFSGGVAPIHSLAYDGSTVRIDDLLRVVPLTRAASFGATTFDRGDIATRLRSGTIPAQSKVRDPHGYASGALAFPLSLAPGAAREVVLVVPLYPSSPVPGPFSDEAASRAWVDQQFAAAVREWSARLDRVDIQLPPSAEAVAASIKANLGYALVSREGAALEPGTRAYRRAWIRDGALISAALLRLGHADAVRDFIEWFAPYQYPNGKIPCCVDKRGADPVPENDSGGEFLYLLMEYYRYTGDRGLLEQMWPRVTRAVAYLDSLRHERMTPAYASGAQRVFYGLLPQSISHEGYSAKPMHSYWDDFFALKGFKDATEIARVLGHPDEEGRFGAMRDEFRRNLMASLALSMEQHRIDFLPGSADLGDFDATSTTIAVAPVGETAALPADALQRTFQEYYRRYQARRAGTLPGDAYTPYELRAVGTMVHLGRAAEANELLSFFLGDQRPAGWHHWAEVVHKDSLAPKYIGDMPHVWVGSDFLRSVLDFFAYVRDDGRALVVGAGIPESWVRSAPGVKVERLRTSFGALSLTMLAAGPNELVVRLRGDLRVPPDGILVRSPIVRPIRRATVDSVAVQPSAGGEITVRRLPAVIRLSY